MKTIQNLKNFFIQIFKNLPKLSLTQSCLSSIILLKIQGNLNSNTLYFWVFFPLVIQIIGCFSLAVLSPRVLPPEILLAVFTSHSIFTTLLCFFSNTRINSLLFILLYREILFFHDFSFHLYSEFHNFYINANNLDFSNSNCLQLQTLISTFFLRCKGLCVQILFQGRIQLTVIIFSKMYKMFSKVKIHCINEFSDT